MMKHVLFILSMYHASTLELATGAELFLLVYVEFDFFDQTDQNNNTLENNDPEVIMLNTRYNEDVRDETKNDRIEPRLFGYSVPTITKLKSVICEEMEDPVKLRQCLRDTDPGESRLLEITGYEFGDEGIAILLDSMECVHDIDKHPKGNNTNLWCELPRAGFQNARLLVVQNGGASAEGNATISYEICLAGTWQRGNENTDCVECVPGKITNTDGAKECEECASSTDFQPASGSTYCVPCPFHASAINRHADCECDEEYYAIPYSQDLSQLQALDIDTYNIYISSNFSLNNTYYDPHESLGYFCVKCPWGANCEETGTTIDTVHPLENFYMGLDGTGEAFFQCLNDACEGGNCSEGYFGPSCTTCGDGLVLDEDFICQPCPSLALSIIAIVVSCMALGGYLGYKMWAQSVHKSPSASSVFFKIIVTTCQVNALAAVYAFSWGHWMKTYLDFQDFLTSIGTAYFELSCFTESTSTSNFVLETLGYIFFPFVVVAFTGITGYFVAHRSYDPTDMGSQTPLQQAYGSAYSVGVLTLFLMQPSLVKQFSLLFGCTQMGASDDDYFFLENLELRCYTPEHNALIYGLGTPLLLLYVCGIPISFFRLLTKPAHKIMIKSCIISEDSQAAASLNDQDSLYAAATARYSLNNTTRTFESAYGFLFLGYKEDFCMWELTVMIRKGLLSLFGVALSHDPRTQVDIFFPSVLKFRGVLVVIQCLMRSVYYDTYLLFP